MKKYGFWLLVLTVLLLFAGCRAKTAEIEPTEFRVACFECKEKFAAGQLNTDFGLCQNCMIKVGAAYCQGCSVPCYTRDMVHGLCTTCNAALAETTVEPEATTEPETTVEQETTVAVDMVNCKQCGRPIASSEAKRGLCPGCHAMFEYQEDERNFATCDVCGVTYGYSDPLVGGICQACWGDGEGPAGVCRMCGKSYTDNEGFESLCFSCQDKYGPKCSVCGTDLTYRGGIDGMCDDCYDAANSCKGCGSSIYKDGYCYYCHPDFTWYCVICGSQNPDYGPADKICDYCKCDRCDAVLTTPGGIDGFCDTCDAQIKVCFICGNYPNYREGYCYYCYPSFTYTCVNCGEQYVAYSESGLCSKCERWG